MITRAKLDAFLAAARDLGVVAVNYIAPEPHRQRPIVSIDAGSREATAAVAAALGLPEPREIRHEGATWLSSSVTGLSVHSEPVAVEHPVHLAAGGAA